MRREIASWLVVVAVVAAGACTTNSPPPERTPDAAADGASAIDESSAVQLLTLTYQKPAVVGTEVSASAKGLPAGREVDLQWGTVTGGWVIEDYYHFRGKKYSEASVSLGRFTVDANGTLNARFAVPEDFGGVHDIVAKIDGGTVAQNGIEVTQRFEMSPASGPLGTPIQLRVTGLGWRTMDSTWVVNWDNAMLGFVSAASSKGSAVARFRATGPAGKHIVHVLTGYQGQGYLNHEQAPNSYLPRPQFTFETTPGPAPKAGYAEPYQRQPVPATTVAIDGAAFSLSPTQGPVQTKATLRGTGFPRSASLRLIWQTYVGNRVSDNGFESQERDMGTVAAGADGGIDAPVSIPDDLGGLHGLVLRDGDRTLAQTYFVIETSIVSMTPSSGPAGTPVTIHLKGVGWTEYDNIYVATYDNAYMGYACGFNTNGDVVINFAASGEPGIHLIDLYPGIYQGPATEPQLLYRLPQLTYAEDHPGNKIPALRFAFEVTR